MKIRKRNEILEDMEKEKVNKSRKALRKIRKIVEYMKVRNHTME